MKYVATQVTLLVTLLIICLNDGAYAQKVPVIHGVIRTKYEYQPQPAEGRFEVRNARVCVSGSINPVIDYKAEIDLSDEGQIRMLDAYTKIKPWKSLCLTAGQMRVPFTIDAHRSPSEQYFANRSFIAKQVGDVRDVGATVGYNWSGRVPIVFQGGFFNGSGLTNQKVWHKSLNYAAKLQLMLSSHWNLTLSAQDIKPDSIRIYLWDAGLYYQNKRLHIEAEYLHKHYNHQAFSDVDAIDVFACYDIPLKKVFNKISLLGRYDYMPDHSDGKTLIDGHLTTTDYARQRITGGVTLSLDKPFVSDIRLNYEKYFYHAGGTPKASERDKFVVEVVTSF